MARNLIAGEGGSVLVRAATRPDVVALACEGLSAPTSTPSGVPVYPADAIPTELDPLGLVRAAAREADVIVWDGGGAAEPWIEPDLHLVAVDLLRDIPIDRVADAYVLTKADSSSPERTRAVEEQLSGTVLLADL